MIFGLIIITFILVNLIFLIFIIYLWRRSNTFRRKLKKEAREVHEALQIGFRILKQELEKDLLLLEKTLVSARDKTLLTKERKIKKSLLKDMGRIEKSIQKEVSDIDRFL